MILHTALHWPEEADLKLLPLAMDSAVHIWNNTPNYEHGLTPNEIISQTLEPTFNTLKRTHVWGFPAYILGSTIQDGQKIPKWNPHAKRGQFLGFSKDHSTQIGLIRNLQTNSITPQYHVAFDDLFTTVTNCDKSGISPQQQLQDWQDILCTGTEQFYDPEDIDNNRQPVIPPPLTPEWLEKNLSNNSLSNRSPNQRPISSPE